MEGAPENPREDQPKPPGPKVDYTKLRPLKKPAENAETLTDRKLRELAFHMSKVPGEKRTAFQIYLDQKAEKGKSH